MAHLYSARDLAEAAVEIVTRFQGHTPVSAEISGNDLASLLAERFEVMRGKGCSGDESALRIALAEYAYWRDCEPPEQIRDFASGAMGAAANIVGGITVGRSLHAAAKTGEDDAGTDV